MVSSCCRTFSRFVYGVCPAGSPAGRGSPTLGPPGVGETQLALGLGVKLVANGWPAASMTTDELLDQLRRDKAAALRRIQRRRYCTAAVLITDELASVVLDCHGTHLSSRCSGPVAITPRRSSRPASPSGSGLRQSPATKCSPQWFSIACSTTATCFGSTSTASGCGRSKRGGPRRDPVMARRSLGAVDGLPTSAILDGVERRFLPLMLSVTA